MGDSILDDGDFTPPSCCGNLAMMFLIVFVYCIPYTLANKAELHPYQANGHGSILFRWFLGSWWFWLIVWSLLNIILQVDVCSRDFKMACWKTDFWVNVAYPVIYIISTNCYIRSESCRKSLMILSSVCESVLKLFVKRCKKRAACGHSPEFA